jgi:hypothetical protein
MQIKVEHWYRAPRSSTWAFSLKKMENHWLIPTETCQGLTFVWKELPGLLFVIKGGQGELQGYKLESPSKPSERWWWFGLEQVSRKWSKGWLWDLGLKPVKRCWHLLGREDCEEQDWRRPREMVPKTMTLVGNTLGLRCLLGTQVGMSSRQLGIRVRSLIGRNIYLKI